MKAYSMDLRVRVLADSDEGLSPAETARKQRVSASRVRRLKQRRRETRKMAPRRSEHASPRKLAGQEERLRALVAERRDLHLAVGLSTLWRKLRELQLPLKKSLHGAEQHRPDVAGQRTQWRTESKRKPLATQAAATETLITAKPKGDEPGWLDQDSDNRIGPEFEYTEEPPVGALTGQSSLRLQQSSRFNVAYRLPALPLEVSVTAPWP